MNETKIGQSRRFCIRELHKGRRIDGGVYLVEASNFKQTRNQKFFIQMTLRDRTGSIKAIRWEASEELYQSFGVDDFVEVRGRVEEFQQQLQVIIDEITKCDAARIDYAEFLPTTSEDVVALESELLAAAQAVESSHLRALLLRVLADEDVRRGFVRCPAGKALHHAYIGGLLEHVVTLLRSARAMVKVYPQLNRDVLTAAAILHDIGKIEELSYTRNFSYTAKGQLLGHIALGLLLVRRKASELPDFPEEVLLEILHIIASHHGEAEFGAIKPPMTAEAIAFHYLDNLDAKLSTLAGIEKDLPPAAQSAGAVLPGGSQLPGGSPTNAAPTGGQTAADTQGRWSDFKPFLGKKIYFPRRESEEQG